MTAIVFSNVYKRFGRLEALSNINFTVPEGSFFGLLGPNGAGKSTLINLSAGLARASQGSVSVLGNDVQRDYRKTRQALGVVPQELVYDPFFSVREMLRLQAGYFGCPPSSHSYIDELIERLDLIDKADTNLHDLSGGMKRRVLVAQALVHRPQVVILDEPTAGVDVELRKNLWQFVSELHREGRTIVLTTHYLEEAESLCDQIAILNHGRVVAMDEKERLLARHPHQFLCLTLGCEGKPLPSALAPLVVKQDGCELTLKLKRDQDKIGAVLDALRDVDIPILELHTRDPGLEEVFIDITAQTNEVTHG
ncbi:MAG TPA: ABC transporter ATP-binding protein [Chromatiaceae bacterium]|jgi:ABC-2 type transport system ATP-binding protein|nr:ABC transporter ATP-binding protein [Chromatiaceae bacterium]HIB83352.1 ABC transporter ATP-binding protein [Chromatiaceae bacterium]HIN83009.1 ABC transporter ATP-binding protein [Chromatiales bacterium]HIO15032.1 ABC transporter ATP-binding protein [Chromatiales bacterium]HIO54367.1 ABC transporter ATP-binding protein [Chromatiales bacterium]